MATRCAASLPTSATTGSSSPRHHGLNAADVAWLLEHAPGEVVVLRPAA